MHWLAYKALTLKRPVNEADALIDLYVSHTDLHQYVILAERHDNPAMSVTNGFEHYADQICERMEIDPSKAIFF